MLRAHKIALDPNNTQATFFSQCCGVARFAYNWALAEWKRQYCAGATPHEAALRKQLNQGKAEEFPWMLASSSLRLVLRIKGGWTGRAVVL